ncbi:SDR family NAD(P)-dependent oxidoreductase [Microvirga massiliensis]|uniref:SDR family NAD(P)-dependent oxidoreductase n=1 Tax=Microvirga massiliensis TaxID=1033741 RepID=UPI0006998F85|nr:SDR family NAD(P)-dependent oxidoreductase [Microvirga massiliensis]
MTDRIDGKLVVITGASSGIGKASALALADQGARLVLAARRKKELEDTADACRAKGAEVITVPTDVAEEAQVQALAQRAIETFGRIDVWFNNAGMDAFGRFEDIPPETFARVLQINLMGMVHGARAVLPHFLERASGILINNASLVGNCPSPFHSPYVASKFAIRGFSFALRQEVLHLPDVHVCVLSPASIDTPLWQRAANYSGRAIKPLDPVHPVEQVASVLANLIRYPQREVFAGASGWMASEQYAAQPAMMEAAIAAYTQQSLFQDKPAVPTDGSLFKPERGNGGTSGGWSSPDRPGLAVGDTLPLMASPAFLALAPALYTLKLSASFAQQLSMQFAPSLAGAFAAGDGLPAALTSVLRRTGP